MVYQRFLKLFLSDVNSYFYQSLQTLRSGSVPDYLTPSDKLGSSFMILQILWGISIMEKSWYTMNRNLSKADSVGGCSSQNQNSFLFKFINVLIWRSMSRTLGQDINKSLAMTTTNCSSMKKSEVAGKIQTRYSRSLVGSQSATSYWILMSKF